MYIFYRLLFYPFFSRILLAHKNTVNHNRCIKDFIHNQVRKTIYFSLPYRLFEIRICFRITVQAGVKNIQLI